MENLKNNIDDITKGGGNLVNDYLKLFGIRQTERLAAFLGVIFTIFIISTLLFIIIELGHLSLPIT